MSDSYRIYIKKDNKLFSPSEINKSLSEFQQDYDDVKFAKQVKRKIKNILKSMKISYPIIIKKRKKLGIGDVKDNDHITSKYTDIIASLFPLPDKIIDDEGDNHE